MALVTGFDSMMGPLASVALFSLLTAWPWWRIYRRAGLPGWWSLSAFIPGVGLLVVMAILGHARWPVLPPRAPRQPSKPRRSLSVAESDPTKSAGG